MVDGGEGNKVVGGVGADDEILRGLQPDGGPEIAEREGDGAAEVDVARVPKESYPRVRLVIDRNLLLPPHLRCPSLGPLLPTRAVATIAVVVVRSLHRRRPPLLVARRKPAGVLRTNVR